MNVSVISRMQYTNDAESMRAEDQKQNYNL